MTKRPAIGRPSAAFAGALSAAFALGVSELAAGLSDRQPSLVTAVGTEFIDRYAASLKEIAVELFGTNDKPALVIGIVVTSILLGAAFGLAAVDRFRVGAAGFVAFACVGAWAYARDPLGSTITGVFLAALAAAAGIGALNVLIHRLPPAVTPASSVVDDGVASDGGVVPAPLPAAGDPRHPSRRAFFAGAAIISAGAGTTAVLGRRLRSDGGVGAAREQIALPRPVSTAPVPAGGFTVDGLSPYVTPNADFYRIDTALTVPQVDPSTWSLDVTGLVDRPLTLSYDELLAMDAVEEVVTLQCVSNEVGGRLVGNAVWQGVPLAELLRLARPRPDATQVVGRSVDRFTAGFPTEIVDGDRVALVAYAMNGEPLPVRHGFPARLVVAGLYGYVSATKWLREIELTTWDDFDGYWISRGWSKDGPIKIASRIDVPRAGATLASGPTPIAGVAWAPPQGISAVEVRIDDGPWAPCRLGDAADGNTWVQWLLDWDAPSGDHVITVRAVDGHGQVQTGAIAEPAPDGATGWHTRRVRVEP